jgi:hypothetical protein
MCVSPWFACAGSVARSLCGCAAGATRAALTQHFARRANAADIAAKVGCRGKKKSNTYYDTGPTNRRATADNMAQFSTTQFAHSAVPWLLVARLLREGPLPRRGRRRLR